MDAKITLSFNEDIIGKAKRFADANNISLSRLTEFLYSKITSGNYTQLEDLPIADWLYRGISGGRSQFYEPHVGTSLDKTGRRARLSLGGAQSFLAHALGAASGNELVNAAPATRQ